jgi:hypothetical protein
MSRLFGDKKSRGLSLFPGFFIFMVRPFLTYLILKRWRCNPTLRGQDSNPAKIRRNFAALNPPEAHKPTAFGFEVRDREFPNLRKLR